MDEIKINPAGAPISIQICFNSMQVVSYVYRIFNTEESEVLQYENGNSNEPLSANVRTLNETADYYLNKKLRISLDLVDPIGGGNDYEILVKILQGEETTAEITISGKTTDADIYQVRWRKFTSF